MRQQYESYKPSGIDWIGDIPYHWNVLPLKRVCTMFGRIGYRGYTIQDLRAEGEGAITLSPSNMVNGGMDFGSVSYLSWEKYHESPEIKIQEGDILFVKTGSTFGKTSYVKGLPMEATINPQILRIVPKTHKKFLAYCMGTPYSQALTDCYVVGSTIPTISQESIGRFMFPVPPLAEQEAIAAWLDEKCEEIDAAIAKVDREIELIDELKQSEISRVVTRGLNPYAPLRPSGIDWINEIPFNWSSMKLKHTVKNIETDFMDGDWIESNDIATEGIRYLTSGNIGAGFYKEQGDGFITEETFAKLDCIEVFPGDLLISRLNEPIARTCFIPALGCRIVTCVDNVIYRPKPGKFDKRYMMYQLNSKPFWFNASQLSSGATMQRISRSKLGAIKVIIPPLSEQQEIADYLDKKCAEIDELKVKLTKKRETLTELRQSIISEVVTGKRKVI